jgi:hypothetical protein
MTEIISIRQKIGLNIFRNINKSNEFLPQWYRKLLIYSHSVKRKLWYKCTYGKTKIYNRRPYGPLSKVILATLKQMNQNLVHIINLFKVNVEMTMYKVETVKIS